jgi:uncharacterized protein with FMN-binding domain
MLIKRSILIKKLNLFCGACLVTAGLAFSCTGIKDFFNPQPDAIRLGELNLMELPDSTYRGQATCGPVKVRVVVQIQDHAIRDIDIIKHRTGQGQPAEAIIRQVIQQQSVQVDVISGATISSKTILKAIKTALTPAAGEITRP